MISYKPLFRYLLENDITKKQCREACHIAPNTWTKINKGEEVPVSVLNKICATYRLSYGDIIEYISQEAVVINVECE